MNRKFIELLGNSDVPIASEIDPFSTSFTLNQRGDIALICNNGKVKMANLRRNNLDFVELNIDGIRETEILEFTTIQFNCDGTVLLLWSKRRIGIIELPLSLVEAGSGVFETNDCRCSFIEVFNCESETGEFGSYTIAKACFHPICSHCLVILFQKGTIRLIDLRNMETQIISLSVDRQFSSFCFGPNMDWLKFSLFILTSNGEIFVLCPIIPSGTIVSVTVLEDLWSYLDELVEDKDSRGNSERDNLLNKYVDITCSYLLDTFGSRPTSSSGSTGDLFVRAGDTNNIKTEISSLFSIVDNFQSACPSASPSSVYAPMLRGPLRMDRSFNCYNSSTANSNSSMSKSSSNTVTTSTAAAMTADTIEDFNEGKIGRSGYNCNKTANDVCILGTNTNSGSSDINTANILDTVGIPVLAVSYSTGEVDIMIIDHNTTTSSSGQVSRCYDCIIIIQNMKHCVTIIIYITTMKTLQLLY